MSNLSALRVLGPAGLAWVVACSNTTINQTNISTTNNFQTLVGAMGATVGDSQGTHVVIPAGALTAEVEVKVGEVVAADETKLAALPAGHTAASAVYVFEPHGQTFGADVTIALKLNAASGNVVLLRAERPESTTWTEVPVVESGSTRILGTSRGFSLYRAAVKGGTPPAGDGGSGGTFADGGVIVGPPDGGAEDPCGLAADVRREALSFLRLLESQRRCNPQEVGQCSGEFVFQGLWGDTPLTACYVVGADLRESWGGVLSAIQTAGVSAEVLRAQCGVEFDPTCGAETPCAPGCTPGAGVCNPETSLCDRP